MTKVYASFYFSIYSCLFYFQLPLLFLLAIIPHPGEVPLQDMHLHIGSLRVIGLSEIGLDFCGAGSGVTTDFESGSPGAFPLMYTPVCLGYHFTSNSCSVCAAGVWSLWGSAFLSLTLNDHITLNPPGFMIPPQSWEAVLLLLEKTQKPTSTYQDVQASISPVLRLKWA